MTKLILSCAGGGVRGNASATFLSLLEKKLIAETGKTIYDSFDMFIGTSIGGIISLLIAGLKMPLSSVEQQFSYENINIMMPQDWRTQSFGLFGFSPKYDGIGKTKVLSNIFSQFSGEDMLVDDIEKPVAVVCYDVENKKTEIINSYKNKQHVRAVDAANATSAAIIYYPTVEVPTIIDGQTQIKFLVDGGIVCNKPSILGYTEAYNMWPDEKIKVLAVGTGINVRSIGGNESKQFGLYQWIKNGFMEILLDESIVHYEAQHLLNENYLRVTTELPDNVSHAIDDVSYNNFAALRSMGEQWFEIFGDSALKFITSTMKDKVGSSDTNIKNTTNNMSGSNAKSDAVSAK